MKTTDILKNISNKEGAGYFSVFLPSLEKTVRIRHLSINDQKIISKLAIEENTSVFASEADLAKISIVETNSLDPIDLETIDVRDYFILCCALRKENYMDEFKVNYECPKCTEEFVEPIDFSRLIEAAKDFEAVIKEEIVMTNNGEAKMLIGIPKQMDLIMLEMYYNRIAQTRDVTAAEKYVDYVICCIQDIMYKNGDDVWEAVEDFADMSFIDKTEFVQAIKANIEQLSRLFSDIGMITSEFFYDVPCPNCKHEIATFMDTSDFFML